MSYFLASRDGAHSLPSIGNFEKGINGNSDDDKRDGQYRKKPQSLVSANFEALRLWNLDKTHIHEVLRVAPS